MEHGDWVRDVAWAPNIGLPFDTIASCSQDGRVVIFNSASAGSGSGSRWEKKQLPPFSSAVWRVSWSITGNILAVSTGDNKVTLWKEGLDGEWVQYSSMSDGGNVSAFSSGANSAAAAAASTSPQNIKAN